MTDQDKPGTDWAAKHAAAGRNATPVADRPYDAWPPSQPLAQPIRESDITTNPANRIEDHA